MSKLAANGYLTLDIRFNRRIIARRESLGRLPVTANIRSPWRKVSALPTPEDAAGGDPGTLPEDSGGSQGLSR